MYSYTEKRCEINYDLIYLFGNGISLASRGLALKGVFGILPAITGFSQKGFVCRKAVFVRETNLPLRAGWRYRRQGCLAGPEQVLKAPA
ncbi:hypothetical protein X474_00825 [Dethiosulfatarculus sandiegensis]|uniref:Uncharacterized protein n=1 Tax=Dethiosulfatarculus sandiegensis TaxID=1429043 RepID=A0A0D2GN61_9BACT|nr:hypothetical protein X474_00825 [Dethiosulfatarculus sandiegensis]